MQKSMIRKGTVLGISLLFFVTSIISTVIGTPNSEYKNPPSAPFNFWKHENIEHFNITDSFNLFTPERTLFGTAYSYNNFSIIPSGDSGFDPWLVWIDDSTGDSGAFEFEDVAYSNHASCFLQIDAEGYIWVSRGGYADVVPFDLYKSNVPLSILDYTGYTKKLDNYWTAVGACSPNVVILGDKVNLFFRNWWNDDSGTEYQQLQYDKSDFSTPLINRYVVLGSLYQGTPIVPCYGWSRVDPRYNTGFLSFCFKHLSPEVWGSYPFIGLTNGGSTLFKGDDSVYSIPLSYQSNIDIPWDNIYQNILAPTCGVNSGVTPGGYNYLITNVYNIPDLYQTARMSVFRDGQWDMVWSGNVTAYTSFAVGVTLDYTVLLYCLDNEIFVMTSDDDCQTWIGPTKIVASINEVNGIAFAQPALDYSDNTIRFFYGEHGGGDYYGPVSKYRFVKFDVSNFHQNAPDIPVITGPSYGLVGENLEYNFSADDLEDDDIFYFVDWGDGTNTGWLGPYESGEQITLDNGWSEGGTYVIQVKAKDIHGAESDWSHHDVFINGVPGIPNIIGPTTGNAGESYEYTFIAFDPDDEEIFYYVDWGDGTNTGWLGPYESGEQIILSYTWVKKDTYEIKCKAKDIHDAEGEWGTLTVTMPCSLHLSPIYFWEQLLERFPNAFPILRHLMGY
jgi:hypothetical protein